MTISLKHFVCLLALTSGAFAQLPTDQAASHVDALNTATSEATTAPVAYVYVTRPTHLDGFAASLAGKLTAVPGSPFSDIDLSHLSVTKKYLFGASDDNESIYSYAIASNGSVSEVSRINVHDHDEPFDSCFNVGPTQLDRTGTTLYNDNWNCDNDDQYIQSFKIESNGSLTFLANSGGFNFDYTMGAPVVLGNNNYLYDAGEDTLGPGGTIQGYKRQSNGAMEYLSDNAYPFSESTDGDPDDVSQPDPVIASDSSNHIAAATLLPDGKTNVLLSFTAQSNGNLTTTNTLAEMPKVGINGGAYSMSMSPTDKLLAVGGGGLDSPSIGKGFQIFHFNGGSPITAFSGVLQPDYVFQQFGWDKNNHLYALGGGYLFVYTVTDTSITPVPGSPYSIPESSSLIVLDLQ
jgi:6-phosphogluconolactonase (cycloisomerase 2 family)